MTSRIHSWDEVGDVFLPTDEFSIKTLCIRMFSASVSHLEPRMVSDMLPEMVPVSTELVRCRSSHVVRSMH